MDDPLKTSARDHANVPAPAASDATQVSDAGLREFTGYFVKRTYSVMRADLAQALKPFGLRMVTFSVLVMIVDNPGLRQSQLAAALAIERPNLVVIIDELQRRKLVVRDRVPTDRRAYALHATKAGVELLEQARQANRDHEARVFGMLSDAEREGLVATLRKIEAKYMEDGS